MSGEEIETASLRIRLRRLSLSDAILGVVLIAIVGMVWNTDRNVAALVKGQERDDELEKRDPAVRATLFNSEKNRIEEKLENFDGRLRKVEETRQ